MLTCSCIKLSSTHVLTSAAIVLPFLVTELDYSITHKFDLDVDIEDDMSPQGKSFVLVHHHSPTPNKRLSRRCLQVE